MYCLVPELLQSFPKLEQTLFWTILAFGMGLSARELYLFFQDLDRSYLLYTLHGLVHIAEIHIFCIHAAKHRTSRVKMMPISGKRLHVLVFSLYFVLVVNIQLLHPTPSSYFVWKSMDSATVFGVSTESMQLSYDPRGNSIPTILLLLQRHMYCQGGLQAEGIFRITAGNSQEEYVRDQLNRGVIPEGIDVHCLAGLIKAWFRELPRGVLDSLSPEQVMQCQSEEACEELVRLLPPTEAALLDWAINLMADVVQEEHRNKMNSRNIAMVFAPNMTQMADPLTALMYAVQVMNFLKTLIEKTLRERGDCVVQQAPTHHTSPSDNNDRQNSVQVRQEKRAESSEETRQAFIVEDPVENTTDEDYFSNSASTQESDGSESCETPTGKYKATCTTREARVMSVVLNQFEEKKTSQSNSSNQTKSESRIDIQQQGAEAATKIECLSRGISNLSRINSITERCEAWR